MPPPGSSAVRTPRALNITKCTRTIGAYPRVTAHRMYACSMSSDADRPDPLKRLSLSQNKLTSILRFVPVGGSKIRDRKKSMKSLNRRKILAQYHWFKAAENADNLQSLRKRKLQTAKATFVQKLEMFRSPTDAKADLHNENAIPPRFKLDSFDSLWLRDSCNCSKCVDPSTKQKSFQTTDIPVDISAASQKEGEDGSWQITWNRDVSGFDSNHVSTYSRDFLSLYCEPKYLLERPQAQTTRTFWDKATISQKVSFFDYQQYMINDDILYKALEQLRIYGLAFIRGVPDDEKAVEEIGGRIGHLRDTFYGRTWNVKSVPQAKNIAYTNVELGFHMDLLYMDDPPGYQLLHCLRNSCEGGESLFSDAFHAVAQVHKQYNDMPNHQALRSLYKLKLSYHYDNAGQHYRKTRSLLVSHDWTDPEAITVVNYSPPFQAPWVATKGIVDPSSRNDFRMGVRGMQTLAQNIEHPNNIYKYKMKEGECAIFNNRRVLHARSAFDVSSGERWLKGAYVDSNVFESRLRVLHGERNGVQAFVASSGLTVKDEGQDMKLETEQ